jgi:hypothetical protein
LFVTGQDLFQNRLDGDVFALIFCTPACKRE